MHAATYAQIRSFGDTDVSGALQITRAALLANLSDRIDPDIASVFEALIELRCAHHPLQYLIGRASVLDFEVQVGPGTFIPRPETEQLVEQALERLVSGRTTIVVAHRLSTVLQADRIIVFDRGGIIGEGSHDELISNNKLYRQFASVQNLSTPQNVTLFRYGSKANETA